MRFLFICQMAGSSEHGMVHRVYALARELVLLGHDVDMVTASFSHTRKQQPDRSGFFKAQSLEGIRYFWLPVPRYSPEGTLGRIVSMAVFTLMACFWVLLKARRQRYEVVFASAPFPTVIFPARVAAIRSGAGLVFDVRDLWPMTLKKLGGYSARHPFIAALQCSEDYACRTCDLLTAVHQNGERYHRSRGLRADRFMHLPNGIRAETESLALDDRHRELLEQLRSDGNFVIGYAGAIGLANSLETLVEGMAAAPDNVHAVIAGDGARVDVLQDVAQASGVAHRLHLLGRIGHRQVPDFLSRIDAGFVATRKSSLYKFGASLTKVGEYMLAGIPIIYGVGDPNNAVHQARSGCEFAPQDAESCAAAIGGLVSMSGAERQAMGERGRTWALAHKNWTTLAERFVERIREMKA